MKKATVTDRELMLAIEFDGRSASELRTRTERALIAEGNLKRVKAQMMKTFSGLPITAQEREAYASEASAMEEEAKAAAALEEIKAARAHARLTIDVWRTLEASHRVVSTYP